MALTGKQKLILKFLKEGDKTKAEIVEKYKYWYYANASKHVGDILTRMVRMNKIVRIKQGTYGLNIH